MDRYKITVKSTVNDLTVNLSEKKSGHRWCNCFKKVFIEQLTKRTGNYKSFDTFLKMVKAVIGSNEINGLSCNIYTVEDLNRLRKEKNENAKCQQDLENKRYLIINYETNFEETHYPLPLNYQGKENKEVTIDYHSILSK